MAEKTKKPLQVYLRSDQIDALQALSRRRGCSMAELVREGVDRILEGIPLEENPLLEIAGMFDSGVGGLSERHDEALTDMIVEENQGGK